jgi:hypothetical protein
MQAKDRRFCTCLDWCSWVTHILALPRLTVQDGVVFKGNVRTKDPREAYAKLKQRLQVRRFRSSTFIYKGCAPCPPDEEVVCLHGIRPGSTGLAGPLPCSALTPACHTCTGQERVHALKLWHAALAHHCSAVLLHNLGPSAADRRHL